MSKWFQFLAFSGRNLADLIFPRKCAHCGRIIPGETTLPVLCGQCNRRLKRLETGFTRQHILSRLEKCYLDELRVAFEITPELSDVIHLIKYKKMPGLGVRLGRLAGEILLPMIQSENSGAVLHPIPLFPRRKRKRGYNQSFCIARGMGDTWQLKVQNKILFRARNTVSQTTLSREGRFENVDRAFRLKAESPLSMNTVILIDDVVTTGATMNECARILKAAGVYRVIGAAAATPVLDSTGDRHLTTGPDFSESLPF